jgi:hypothetical protein
MTDLPKKRGQKTETYGPRYASPAWIAEVRGECGCSILSTHALAVEQAKCYLSSRPAGVVDIEYREACGHCRGAGRRSLGRYRFAACKHCKGEGLLTEQHRIQTFVGPEWKP